MLLTGDCPGFAIAGGSANRIQRSSIVTGRWVGHLGVTASHLATLEKGRTRLPGFSPIESLARFFGVTCDPLVRRDLIDGVGREPNGAGDRALRRIAENVDAAELGCILALVGVAWRQARGGRSRESTHRRASSPSGARLR